MRMERILLWAIPFLFVPLMSMVLFSYIHEESVGITSTYVRSEWPATDIPLDSEVFKVPEGRNAPQQDLKEICQLLAEKGRLHRLIVLGWCQACGICNEPAVPGIQSKMHNKHLGSLKAHHGLGKEKVHITQGDYDGKAVIISWVTPDEPGSSKVQYGTSEDKFDCSAEGTVANYSFYKYNSGYIHHCFVDGLEYDKRYFYKIGSDDSSRKFWFQTPPMINPDSSYKFGIIGDLGQTYNSLSTLEHYLQSGAQTVLYVGDLSYADKNHYNDIGLRWDTWGRLVEKAAAYQPWIWSVGNHEIEYLPELGEVVPFKSYLHRYTTPYATCESSDPLWYAIRRASAHIIVLSSYSPFARGMPQWKWLKEELKRVDREKTPWLIVLMHIPFYSSNEANFMEGESMRSVFEEWFVHYKVDVIFAGHVHAYERSNRISNIQYRVSSGECYPVLDKAAPLYINVGDGGNQQGLAESFIDPQPQYSAFRESSYGHSTLEIKNRTHAFYHWNRNDDGLKVHTDSMVLLNQHWASNDWRSNQ